MHTFPNPCVFQYPKETFCSNIYVLLKNNIKSDEVAIESKSETVEF